MTAGALVMILTPEEAAWYAWKRRGRLARFRDRLLRRQAPPNPWPAIYRWTCP